MRDGGEKPEILLLVTAAARESAAEDCPNSDDKAVASNTSRTNRDRNVYFSGPKCELTKLVLHKQITTVSHYDSFHIHPFIFIPNLNYIKIAAVCWRNTLAAHNLI